MKTLCLSGWAQPADALEGIASGATHVDYAQASAPETVLDYLAEHHPQADIVIGWSLGGQLALRALATGALQAKALVLLGVPYQYLRCEAFPHGMGRETYALFREGYVRDTVRTCRRFSGLIAVGDAHERRIAKTLEPNNMVGHNTQRWLPWLEDLAAQSVRSHTLDALPPALIIHGVEDAIVFPQQAEALHAALPSARLEWLEVCGHAPHLHDPQRIRRMIEEHAARHVV